MLVLLDSFLRFEAFIVLGWGGVYLYTITHLTCALSDVSSISGNYPYMPAICGDEDKCYILPHLFIALNCVYRM